MGYIEECGSLLCSRLRFKETAEYSSTSSWAILETTGGTLVEAVVSRNPQECNECLFNLISAPGTVLIAEIMVVSEKATVW